jgi:protein-S-isoprenylcysteine O-methyltransferase Ste14
MTALVLKILVLSVIAGNLLAFARAITRHFARPEGLPPVMRVITVLGWLFAMGLLALHALAQEWVPWRVSVGLLLCALSAWLFRAALRANQIQPLSVAGSRDQPQHLNQRGPYGRIRHPFYASYLYTWLGAGMISPHLWALIPAVVMGGLYWHCARAEERKFLNSPLAEPYRAYRRRAGLFWPRPA